MVSDLIHIQTGLSKVSYLVELEVEHTKLLQAEPVAHTVNIYRHIIGML